MNQYHQSETFFAKNPERGEDVKTMKNKYESVSDGLKMLLRKCDNINMVNHDKKLNGDFPEFEDYDVNQNSRGMQSLKKSPNRKTGVNPGLDTASPTVQRNHLEGFSSSFQSNEHSSRGPSKDESFSPRKVPSSACDNCRLTGMCLHGRYLERVITKTEGMRVRAVGAGWDRDTLGRVGQVAGGGPGGRVKIRWAWQSGVGGDEWRRLRTYSLSWQGEFSFQFWCRDPEQEQEVTQGGRVIDLVPRR